MAIEAEALRALSDGEVEALSRKLALLLLEERPMTTGRLDTLARIRPIIREMYPAFAAIHRSALAEDTARAVEGWPSIDSAPQNGAPVWGICMEAQTPKPKITWWANGWHTVSAAEKFAPAGPHKWWPTHWTPLEAPTRLPSKEAADANR